MSIFEHIENLRTQLPFGSKKPILLLDVDDTLIDCRHRKHRVFMDFIDQEGIARAFPEECRLLRALPWQKIRYRVPDNLQAIGVQHEAFSQALLTFWRHHYFTFPYLLQDIAFPGAVAFVRHFYARGYALVYLTARDEPGMGAGTLASLEKLDFPLHGPDLHLLLKQDVAMEDHVFKRDALEAVAAIGPVVAAFENELGNLNEMARRFPDAAVYWRNTLYAPEPPAPHPRIEILAAFPEQTPPK